jgi:hypothetical protein
MQGLSERTRKIVSRMFLPGEREDVAQFLLNECGNNLPGFEKLDEIGLERIWFAVLKLSGGRLDVLLQVIQEAQEDWRDTLMAAGFGYDATEHDEWAIRYLQG